MFNPSFKTALRVVFGAGSLLLLTAYAQQGPAIFDDSATAGVASHQVPGANGADNGVGALINVSVDTPITGFGLETYQMNGGNLKFIIYDETSHAFSLVTGPKSFGTAYFDIAQSPSFVFTLMAGHTYDLGAISDSDTYYAYGYSNDGNGTAPVTQNGITAPVENLLFTNYANPNVNPVTSGGYGDGYHGAAQFALQIYGTAVPEPSTVTLMIGAFCLLGCGWMRRRLRSDRPKHVLPLRD